MNFAFVMHNLVRGDGQGRIQFEIVRHLLQAGHRATVFASRVDPKLPAMGATHVHINESARLPNLISGFQFARVADRAIEAQRTKFDVIVAAGFTTRRRHDVSLCQFVHGAWLRSPVHVSRTSGGPRALYQSLYTRCNAKWERQSYAAAGCVVAPSRKIEQELQSIGVPAGKIEVIYNGVDLEEFQPGQVSRAALNLPESCVLGLFVGDIRTGRKNLDSVLKAMQPLPGVHLAVVGAVQRSPFPAMAASLGISDRVHFVGFRSDVHKFMQAADLFVFPSRYEAGTLVLLEALASGLPVVTARSAGGCEVMTEEAGVILDDPNDIVGLTNAIDRFATDPGRRAEASRAARAVASQYSWRQMAERYLALFERARR